jgi:hypothetical protein
MIKETVYAEIIGLVLSVRTMMVNAITPVTAVMDQLLQNVIYVLRTHIEMN